MPLPKTKRFRVLRESPADANVAQGIGGVNKLQTPGLSPPVVATAQTRPRPKSAVQSRLMAAPSILLVHGAANGAWVWDAWRRHLGPLGWVVNVLDLRGHGRSLPIDLAQVTMEDYVADLASVTRQIAAAEGRHPVVGGWSMGGLVALMYAAGHQDTPALLLLSPSPPLQVAGRASPEEVRSTPAAAFGTELYGVYPDDLEASRRVLADLTEEEAAMVLANSRGAAESGVARRQRKRGISVAPGAVRCPALVVFGDEDRRFAPDINRRTALYLGGETLCVPGAGHWGIVCGDRFVAEAAPKVDTWLRQGLGTGY